METLQRTANRGSISTGYEIDNSLKFEEDNTERLEVTFSSEGDRRTFTYSFWHKRTELGRNQMVFSAGDTYIYFDSNDAIAINFRNEVAVNYFKITNAKYRDISAWYHVVVRCDTTQGTAADRSKLWVNGEEVTSFSLNQADNMSLNHQTSMNDNITHMIGAPSNNTTTYKLSGYLSEFHHVDGQALSPTDFGEYDDDSGIWKPKEYTGTYGTNGFFLEFKNAASVGADTSGNGNSFSVQNLNQNDQATDTPTNNFCTLNPLQGYNPVNNEYFLYTEGNTRMKNTLANVRGSASTISVNKGKWYAEWKYTAGTSLQLFVGILAQDKLASEVYQNGYSAATTCTWYPKQELSYYRNNGTLVTASATRNSTIAAGDVIGMFLDMDNNHLYFQKNGSDINVGEVDASTLLFKESNLFDCNDQYVCFYANVYDSTNEITWNFGGLNLTGETTSYSDANNYGNFKYEPVRGSDNYYALCTKNIAEYG